jgi:hypothetical protein
MKSSMGAKPSDLPDPMEFRQPIRIRNEADRMANR